MFIQSDMWCLFLYFTLFFRMKLHKCTFPSRTDCHIIALHLNITPLFFRSSTTVRSHHDPSASENYNHHNNNHCALGCGQHHHHNGAQRGQQGSAEGASLDPTDHLPSIPWVLPFTWALLQGHRGKRHNMASDPAGHAGGAALPQGNAR